MSIDRAAEIVPQSCACGDRQFSEIDDQMALVSDAFDSLERARETLKEAEKASKRCDREPLLSASPQGILDER